VVLFAGPALNFLKCCPSCWSRLAQVWVGAGLLWLCIFAFFVFAYYDSISRSLWRGWRWNPASMCLWGLSNLSARAACKGSGAGKPTPRGLGLFDRLVLFWFQYVFDSAQYLDQICIPCLVRFKRRSSLVDSSVLWQSEVPQRSYWANYSCLDGIQVSYL
jgi:hypothetical protein